MSNKLTVTAAFAELDQALKLDKTEYADAIATHAEITDYLKSEGLIAGAFLQGSLARKTMIDPLRDIDKVVLIKEGDRDAPGNARTMAETFEKALAKRYPDLAVDVGKHSVTIDFGPDTFEFDVVPAYDLGDDVLIINTKTDGWEPSNTRRLIKVIQDRNGECNGRFIYYARAGKLYVRENLEGCVPGLHVEAFAYNVITTEMAADEALAAILAEGVRCLAPGVVYYDPSGVGRLDNRLDPADRTAAHLKFTRDAHLAAQAVSARKNGEDNAAIAIWHSLLGDCFPKPDEAAALKSIGEGVGVTNVVTRTAPVAATPTRAWRS